jgi:hypothetical protein
VWRQRWNGTHHKAKASHHLERRTFKDGARSHRSAQVYLLENGGIHLATILKLFKLRRTEGALSGVAALAQGKH